MAEDSADDTKYLGHAEHASIVILGLGLANFILAGALLEAPSLALYFQLWHHCIVCQLLYNTSYIHRTKVL